jgi:hypothetical protein
LVRSNPGHTCQWQPVGPLERIKGRCQPITVDLSKTPLELVKRRLNSNGRE